MSISTHPGLQEGPIYLDYNATTPVDPLVMTTLLPFLSTDFGNPSSSHSYGRASREAIGIARKQVALILGCASDEIVFTGSGSESDMFAIRGSVLALQKRGNHIITQVTEHPAVLNLCKALERLHDIQVTYLPVDDYGRISPADVEAAITERTTLITIMHANNETGTLQPISEVAEIAHRYSILFHTDASQSVGKISTQVVELGVDLLTVTGHKLYAPKGIGALYVRRGLHLEPLIYGGGQEAGRRSGTENTAFMVALGSASVIAYEQLGSSLPQIQSLRNHLHRLLESELPGLVHLNGHPTERLPNTLNISIEGVIGEELLAATPEIAATTGSACHEGNTEPSSVLLAMGLSRERAMGALRLTLGRWSTEDEVEKAASVTIHAVKRLRGV